MLKQFLLCTRVGGEYLGVCGQQLLCCAFRWCLEVDNRFFCIHCHTIFVDGCAVQWLSSMRICCFLHNHTVKTVLFYVYLMFWVFVHHRRNKISISVQWFVSFFQGHFLYLFFGAAIAFLAKHLHLKKKNLLIILAQPVYISLSHTQVTSFSFSLC